MSFFKSDDRRYFFSMQNAAPRRGAKPPRKEYGLVVLLSDEQVTGWGRTDYGQMFALVEGQLTSSINRFTKIAFSLRMSSTDYPIRCYGDVDSSQSSCLMAHGQWYRKTGFWYWQYERGDWHMALQATPLVKHIDSAPQPQLPVMVVATSWDTEGALCRCVAGGGESGETVYEELACGGNVADAEWDLFVMLTGKTAEAAEEVARGRDVLQKHREARSAFNIGIVRASTKTSGPPLSPSPYGWLRSVESAAVSLLSFGATVGMRTQYSWAPGFALLPIVAALSGDTSGYSQPGSPVPHDLADHPKTSTSTSALYSFTGCAETNYIPHLPSVNGTAYDRRPNVLPALCTEFVMCKRSPLSTSRGGSPGPLNPSGGGDIISGVESLGQGQAASAAGSWCDIIHTLLHYKDVVMALKIQLLVQYASWDVLVDYADGLEGIFCHLAKVKMADGKTSVLTPAQVRLLTRWLTGEVREAGKARTSQRSLAYVEKVNWQLLRLLTEFKVKAAAEKWTHNGAINM